MGGMAKKKRQPKRPRAATLSYTRRGRRCALTPEKHEEIVRMITEGQYACTACAAVGINPATYYRWLEKGKADIEADTKSIYRDFCEAIDEAEAHAELRAVDTVRRHSIMDPGTAMQFLGRRFPARWGTGQNVKAAATARMPGVKDDQGNPAEVVFEFKMDDGAAPL